MKHGMKIILASAASLAVLAGCESATDLRDAAMPSRASTPSSTASSTYEPKSDEEISVAAMESTLLKEGINLPPGLALDYSDAVCSDLGDGVDPMNIAFTAHDHLPMYDIIDHAMMVGASVGAFCPEYSYIIDRMGE